MSTQENEKKGVTEANERQQSTPLIFISHDSRDEEIAEAFSKLLKSVSAGFLKSFRSSDKKGMEGIEFGDEWYKRLMVKLDSASDVVCLLTERSLERPWILYEAGVAKGKLDTSVFGVAIGIPLNKVSTGPFYQFQNCDDSEDSLIKLVMQLLRRIPSCEPDDDVVKAQVKNFKAKADEIISNLAGPDNEEDDETSSASASAKLFEELKVMFRDLPSRVEDRLADSMSVIKRRKKRRFHPMMFEEIMHAGGPEAEPIGFLVFASLIRDDAPWLYEISVEAYRAITSGSQKAVENIKRSLKLFREFPKRSPIFEEFGIMDSKEMHMLMMEGPRMLERMITRCVEENKELSDNVGK